MHNSRMPTVISHPAIPIALAMIGGRIHVPVRLLLAATVASILPDTDVAGFYWGIPYDQAWGHRGFSHSIAFALIIGCLGILLASRLRASKIAAFMVLFISTLSHGILDALTTGGLGVAFFSPFSNQRLFLPWQYIQVAPISIMRFFSVRGLGVLKSEFMWIWLSSLTIGIIVIFCRKIFSIQSLRRTRGI
jgi:inner membrane protein